MTTPSPYAAIAADLHTIADAIATINHHDPRPYVRLALMPGHSDDPYEQRVAHIDAVAQAVLGQPAESEFSPNEYGTHSHEARGNRGHVHVSIHGRVTPPGQRDKDAELAELRAQLAEAQRQLAEKTEPADEPYGPGDLVQIDGTEAHWYVAGDDPASDDGRTRNDRPGREPSRSPTARSRPLPPAVAVSS